MNGNVDAKALIPPDSLITDEAASQDSVPDLVVDNKSFGLRMMDTQNGRNEASLLINKMYAWRGYGDNHQLAEDPNRITLAARDKQGNTVGTITVGIDSSDGILADHLFKEEIDAYRARDGVKVCEFTKLAFDPGVQSKEAMGSLFHLAVMYARDLHHCTDLFIEVNPRHRRFYQHMLGFTAQGSPKTNARVNAPAHLMWVSLAYITEQVKAVGGKGALSGERSFYAMFFSEAEEQGILQRLRAIH
ncbi:MAG: N-acetyltransferase [Pseudomonadota bacterium]